MHVLPQPLAVAGLAVELLFSLSKPRLQISIPPPPRLQIHRLPHKHTHTGRARIGSVIDRGDTEYKEAIREIVMREEGRRRGGEERQTLEIVGVFGGKEEVRSERVNLQRSRLAFRASLHRPSKKQRKRSGDSPL